jgi:hypothetical protein
MKLFFTLISLPLTFVSPRYIICLGSFFTSLSTSDIIQIISITTTILLGVLAFFAPRFFERWKRNHYKPKLSLRYKYDQSPYTNKTFYRNGGKKVLYWNLGVKNVGKTQAENCEVVLEEVSKEEGSEYKKLNHTPGNLKWPRETSLGKVIQPYREIICNVGHIDEDTKELIFDIKNPLNSQVSALKESGNYKIVIKAYSNNAESIKSVFAVKIKGKKYTDTEDISEIIDISRINL